MHGQQNIKIYQDYFREEIESLLRLSIEMLKLTVPQFFVSFECLTTQYKTGHDNL